MKKILLLTLCLLPLSLLAQVSKERPQWVNGERTTYKNSYTNVFSASAETIDKARREIENKIISARAMETGMTRYSYNSNEPTVSSSANLYVRAGLLDEYVEKSAGGYTVYQLIQTAMFPTDPNRQPEKLTITKSYPASPRALIPGMAQLHKGSMVKGVAFIVAEIAAVGGVVAFESQRSSKQSKINSTHNAIDRQKYIDDANSAEDMRNICIAGAAAVYVWNVIDGFVAKGKKHVEVGNVAMNFAPYATPNNLGLAMRVTF